MDGERHQPVIVRRWRDLAVAALFQPSRRRIQQAVDRRKDDAAKTIERAALACVSRSIWTISRLSC